MPRKRFGTEQIITKLRQAEVEFGLAPLPWTGTDLGLKRSAVAVSFRS